MCLVFLFVFYSVLYLFWTAGEMGWAAMAAACCWACGAAAAALGVVLRLAVSSGGLNRHDKAAVSGTCREWRRVLIVSRIPTKLDSKGAGRKWLQGWYHALERQIAAVPSLLVAGGDRQGQQKKKKKAEEAEDEGDEQG